MFKFDLESESYDFAANLVSTVIGIGAGSIIGSLCDNIIDTTDCSNSKKALMSLGRTGFKSVSMFAISNEMRKNVDDLARAWNTVVDIFEANQSGTEVEPEIVG